MLTYTINSPKKVKHLKEITFENHEFEKNSLYRMRSMKNNNRWIFEQIKPYLGSNILEIGSGIGNISKFIAPLNVNLILTDIKENYLNYLQRRFINNPKVKVFKHDILSSEISNILHFKINTVVCTNVLEHIEDDDRALENIYKILFKNGHLILVIPAMKFLYGSLDKKASHFRRYHKKELVNKLENRNFEIEKAYYLNFISTIGWFINSKILKRKLISSFQINILDKFIPFFSKIEKRFKIPFGLSLIIICRKK